MQKEKEYIAQIAEIKRIHPFSFHVRVWVCKREALAMFVKQTKDSPDQATPIEAQNHCFEIDLLEGFSILPHGELAEYLDIYQAYECEELSDPHKLECWKIADVIDDIAYGLSESEILLFRSSEEDGAEEIEQIAEQLADFAATHPAALDALCSQAAEEEPSNSH